MFISARGSEVKISFPRGLTTVDEDENSRTAKSSTIMKRPRINAQTLNGCT